MTDARTPRFLMANLGSEVLRLLRSKEKGDAALAGKCLERAQKIIDQVLSAPEMVPRKRELELLKAVIDDLLRDNPEYQVTDQELKDYFLPLASRAV